MRNKRKQTKKTGLPPGSLVYTGKHRHDDTFITLVQYNEDRLLEQKTRNSIPAAKPGDFLNWYDIRGLHQLEIIEQIGEQFNMHPLILEDILNIEQRPKFEDYDNGLFIIAESLSYNKTTFEIDTEQVSIFLGENFLISFQETETDLFENIRVRLDTSKGRIRRREADYLAYALLDAIIDHYFEVLDEIEDSLDLLESEILYQPSHRCKAQVHALKLGSLYFRKHVSPLRDAISQFSRSDSPFIQPETGVFLRDLYDHVVRVVDMVETHRDVLNGLYDLYLSEISYKMNNVMQILTIISTIFIPLTFLAGVYGMNFDHMPELHWPYGYYFVWAIMIGVTIFLLLVFKRKKWL